MLARLLAESELRGGKNARASLYRQLLPDFRHCSVAYKFVLSGGAVPPLCCQFTASRLLNGCALLAVGSESGFMTIVDTSSPGGYIQLRHYVRAVTSQFGHVSAPNGYPGR